MQGKNLKILGYKILGYKILCIENGFTAIQILIILNYLYLNINKILLIRLTKQYSYFDMDIFLNLAKINIKIY